MNRKYPRAAWHDYNGGLYFVTVVTKFLRSYFGRIEDGVMCHSAIGEYLSAAIEQTGLHYKGVSVDCQIVMPNHFHAVINIASRHAPVRSRHAAALPNGHAAALPNGHAAALPKHAAAPQNNFGCLRPPMHPDEDDNFNERNHHNARLSTVIGGIKSATTRFANQKGLAFGWQANFHDHIIRNQREYDYISEYIRTNPLRWGSDKFHD